MNLKTVLWDEVETQPEPEKRTGLEIVALVVVVLIIIGLVTVWASI